MCSSSYQYSKIINEGYYYCFIMTFSFPPLLSQTSQRDLHILLFLALYPFLEVSLVAFVATLSSFNYLLVETWVGYNLAKFLASI